MEENSSWGWVAAGVASIGGTLATAVATLYRSQVKIYESRISELESEVISLSKMADECQEKHTATRIELATLSERLRSLEKINDLVQNNKIVKSPASP